MKELLDLRCQSAANWERSSSTHVLLGLLRSDSFVSRVLKIELESGASDSAPRREASQRRHRWRLEVLDVAEVAGTLAGGAASASAASSSSSVEGSASTAATLALAAGSRVLLPPLALQASCGARGAPREVPAALVSALVAGAVQPKLPARGQLDRASPNLCLQQLFLFGMLRPCTVDGLMRDLRGDAHMRLFRDYSHSSPRVACLCRLLLPGSTKRQALALLPRILPTLVLEKRMGTIRDLSSLLDESVESLCAPQLPFILSAIAQQPVERVAAAFMFMLESIYRSRMTIKDVCGASLGKLLVLILWNGASGVGRGEDRNADPSNLDGLHAAVRGRVLLAMENIVSALRAHSGAPAGSQPAGDVTASQQAPRKRKLSDFLQSGSSATAGIAGVAAAAAGGAARRRAGDVSAGGVIAVPGAEALPGAAAGPSAEVVQTIGDNILHVLDIVEIVLSGQRDSPKWAEYSPLLVDEQGERSMNYRRLFFAVSLLFDLVPGSLHRFAPKIWEFLQSATALSDFQPESIRCWQIFVRSVGVQRLQALVPAIVGELLRLASRLRRSAPRQYERLCRGLLSELVESSCAQHSIVASLPALPKWPELEKALAALEKAQGLRRGESFAARLEAAITSMESATHQAAKSAILRHLLDLVAAQRSSAPNWVTGLSTPILARLLRALLAFLWESSAWPDDQLKCGELLGDIGAVDPSRFPQLDLLGGSRSSRTPAQLGNMEHLASCVLADFLVPNLTSDTAYAFAAQEILKYLQKSQKSTQVLSTLKDDVRDTLRPYLQSSYKLIEPGESLSDTSAFEGVAAQAASFVQGDQRAFFEACLPAVYGNHALALFLMHHMLYHIINSNATLAQLEKLSRSLAHLLDSTEHSTAQAVFALVDDLAQRREDIPAPSKPGDVTAIKKLQQRIDEVMKCITPRKVVSASIRCGAHARALQFLERAIVSEAEGRRTSIDGPRLESEDDCLLLQSIYRHLEEPDGVLGALRAGPSSCRTRTLHLEETGRWHEALSCYEEQLATIPANLTPAESSGCGADASVSARRQDLLSGVVRCNQNMRRFESSMHLIHGIGDEDSEMCARLRPFAVEAAWQLSHWDGLKSALGQEGNGTKAPISADHDFQIGLGQAMMAIHERSTDTFDAVIRESTLQVTRQAASAARDSYQRTYGHLLKLHVLSDLRWLRKDIMNANASKGQGAVAKSSFAQNLLNRAEATAPTFAARELLLSPLRVALADMGMLEDSKLLELEFLRLCKKQKAHVPIVMQHPSVSFMNVSPPLMARAQLEWGKLLYKRGSRNEALWHMQQLADKHPKARLLGTRWATEAASELLIPRIAEADFLRAKDELPDNEAAWFHHASYLDKLLKGQLQNKAGANSNTPGQTVKRSNSTSSCPFDLKNLVTFTLRGYLQSVHRGTKRLTFVMSRVLQLAWDCCELDLHGADAIAEIDKQSVTMQPWMWYVVMTQLISRVHNQDMRNLFIKLIMQVVYAYPWQAGWQIMQVLKSSNKEHAALGHKMVLEMSRKSKDVHGLLTKYYHLCQDLINLANHIPAEASTMSLRPQFARLLGAPRGTPGTSGSSWTILVPLQSQMTAIIPGTAKNVEHPFPDRIITQRCLESVDVFRTKEKPKKITFVGSDGRNYPFLCKAERRGDLRKDARLMEFAVMINQLLQRNPETRRRNLEVRTFHVVIFAESCGLIEWVSNTKGMRIIIDELWRSMRSGQQQTAREIKDMFDRSHNLYETFVKQVLPRHPPILHHWFSLRADPSTWLSRRLSFSRSQALWCMLGYVVGLGDRHGENILLDTESGMMVHVDFDCIFGKGMLLERPETVPFRLTQNCVSAMGVTGVEGAFRQSCELAMGIMRDNANQQTLLSVLHAFIADPLIEWASRSRQQDLEEHRIQQARSTIGDVEKKLNGMLNVGAVVGGLKAHLEPQSVLSMEERGRSLLGRDRGVGLSVAGQVDELLKAAMCKRNLSEMYVGWQPWQ
eukprot:TRINITY_DN16595_c0_g1_i1.p1 TRINITY_DN16595_c0_g1~~TRINITY_DN16595_c0_g1_i1.p1  ORF type:complete len:1979 (+),score=374.06 TRINITY_DN16595_c0_g1_i1:1109-7045(+)